MPLETRRAESEELEALAPIVGWAFGGGTSRALDWLRAAGAPHVRVARLGQRVVGGLVEIPMGQWFGAQSVPTLGLAGVAIAPEARGQGLALGLLRDTLRSARQQGVALSTLYPSTFRMYRKAGYELAGSHCRFTLQLQKLARAARPLAVEALDDAAQPALESLYREVARRQNGYLDRGAYVWSRVRRPDMEPARAFGVPGGDGLDGYVYLKVLAPRRAPLELSLSDFVARTPDALASLLAFLGDHFSTVERASWTGGPSDARLLGVSERVIQSNVEDYWMLRLVDVRAALLARGYPPLDAELELDVRDELLPENSGRYLLALARGAAHCHASPSVAAGAGTSAAPGTPVVRLSVGALAALYTGFATPWQLATAGRLQAGEDAQALLASIFAGPAPGLPDFF
jgi:predicted acetyltransferase